MNEIPSEGKMVQLRFRVAIRVALLSFTFFASPGHAAVDPVSAAVVYKGIQDAITDLQSLVEGAGAEVKGAALQLEVQLKELLATLDSTLKNRVNESFDRLDDSQRLLTRNAQQTLESTVDAIDALREKSFGNAKDLLREADMAAYNAMYSLPCRDKVPRIVYTTPGTIRVGSTQIDQLTVHGNFLRLGDREPVVKLDNTLLKIDALGDNDISVSLPPGYLAGLQLARPVSLTIQGLTKISTYNVLVGCPSFKRSVTEPIKAQVVVRPEVTHAISARLLGNVNSEIRHPAAFKHTHTQGTSSCSTNADASTKYCLPPGDWTVGRADLSGVYTRCPSWVKPPIVATDDRCAVVPARIVSCGRRWGDCKGTGKISYTITLEGVERKQTPLKDATLPPVTLTGSNTASTAFTFSVPKGTDPNSLKYVVKVVSMEGKTKLREVSLTSDLGYVDGYRAELNAKAGLLTVLVPSYD